MRNFYGKYFEFQFDCNPGRIRRSFDKKFTKMIGTTCHLTYGLTTVLVVDVVDGRWTRWSSWTECSVTCGTGEKTRTRTCTNPEPAYGGDKCTGDDTKTKPCDAGSCNGDGRFVHYDTVEMVRQYLSI